MAGVSLEGIRAEGPAVHPAKGNALVDRRAENPSSGPTGQPFPFDSR